MSTDIVLRVTYTRAAFQMPGDDSVRINLDTDIALIREDALDEDRPCRDPSDWHRSDIDSTGDEYPFPHVRKGEIARFPFAVLEIKTTQRNSASNAGPMKQDPQWVSDLMNSHLVKEAPRFSKYAHGVAFLFESYVNLLPFWLPEMDEDIRRDPKQAYDEQQDKQKRGRKLIWSPRQSISESSGQTKDAPKGKTSDIEELPPVPESKPTESPERREGVIRPLPSVQSLLSRVKGGSIRRHHSPVSLPPGVRKPNLYLKNAGPVKVEEKVWLANERTFIKWMHLSTLMAMFSLGLYNATVNTGNGLGLKLGVTYAVIAVVAALWAYYSYLQREKEIRGRSPKHMDDRIGPIVVGIALVVALSANFGIKVTTMRIDLTVVCCFLTGKR